MPVDRWSRWVFLIRTARRVEPDEKAIGDRLRTFLSDVLQWREGKVRTLWAARSRSFAMCVDVPNVAAEDGAYIASVWKQLAEASESLVGQPCRLVDIHVELRTGAPGLTASLSRNITVPINPAFLPPASPSREL